MYTNVELTQKQIDQIICAVDGRHVDDRRSLQRGMIRLKQARKAKTPRRKKR